MFKVFRALHHAGWTLRMHTQLHPIAIIDHVGRWLQEKSGEGHSGSFMIFVVVVFFLGAVLAAALLHEVAFVQQLQCSAQSSWVQSCSGEARRCQHPATSHHCRSVGTVWLPSSTDQPI